MTRYARGERAALADALAGAGPDAPTLCAGWTTRDLAAHLILRERHPLRATGILLKPLSGWTARYQNRLAARDYSRLVDEVRRPPAWSPVSNPLTDETANLLEMYVHHEDVRRAQPGWKPRTLDDGLAGAVWGRVRGVARLALRRFPAAVTVAAPGHGEVGAGAGGPAVRVSGGPGELALFLMGRQAVAEVEVTGPDEVCQRLRTAPLGI